MDSNPPGLLRPDYEADRRSAGAKLGFHPPGAPKLEDHLGEEKRSAPTRVTSRASTCREWKSGADLLFV